PFRDLLDRGVRVALGTDSRASNPDLSLLAEMRFLAAKHPQLRGSEILHAGTFAGAIALGRGDDHGSLEPGKLANMVAIVLDKSSQPKDPHDAVLQSENAPIAVMRNGSWNAV